MAGKKVRSRKPSAPAHQPAVVTPFPVEQVIRTVRGHRVILDEDIAAIYGVPTKRLNEQVKRNADRFPEDFMFQLTAEERDALRSQSATSKTGRGGRRYRPYAFTEHGAIMAANILNSRHAIEASVYVVRAFVRMRGMLAANRERATGLKELARRGGRHDEAIRRLVATIRELMAPPEEPPKGRMGFHRPQG